MSREGVLRADTTLVWAGQSDEESAHEIVIMANGWLRVTWTSGVVVHVSPAAVKAVYGKGVSYGG